MSALRIGCTKCSLSFTAVEAAALMRNVFRGIAAPHGFGVCTCGEGIVRDLSVALEPGKCPVCARSFSWPASSPMMEIGRLRSEEGGIRLPDDYRWCVCGRGVVLRPQPIDEFARTVAPVPGGILPSASSGASERLHTGDGVTLDIDDEGATLRASWAALGRWTVAVGHLAISAGLVELPRRKPRSKPKRRQSGGSVSAPPATASRKRRRPKASKGKGKD